MSRGSIRSGKRGFFRIGGAKREVKNSMGERKGGGKQKRRRLFFLAICGREEEGVEMATAGVKKRKESISRMIQEKRETSKEKRAKSEKTYGFIRMGKKGILNLLNNIKSGKDVFEKC